MRIVSGSLGGRQFAEPHGKATHPMSEKARGALFNVLGDLDGLEILDAFAGSGALAFEAASRGAKSVIAIEKDRASHSVIDRNVQDLGLEGTVKAIRANSGGWSIHNMEKQFDILLLDPPYDKFSLNVMRTLLHRHLKPDGAAVLSWPGKNDLPEFDGYKLINSKNYGDAQLAFYRKN